MKGIPGVKGITGFAIYQLVVKGLYNCKVRNLEYVEQVGGKFAGFLLIQSWITRSRWPLQLEPCPSLSLRQQLREDTLVERLECTHRSTHDFLQAVYRSYRSGTLGKAVVAAYPENTISGLE